MARLPQPGGDDGNWGDILNDYLLQAHETNGTIKANAVDSAAIQGNSISGSKLQDNTITTAKLAVTGGSDGQVLSKNSGQSGGLQWISPSGVPDADASTKGIVQLTNHLGGTAAAPTVPGLANKVDTTRQVATTHSLTGGGDLSANRTLSLVNDAAAPGNDKYYGTNGSGTKGYHDLPAGSAPDYPNNSGVATIVPRPSITDVRDYGATGDGSTDDTAAINAAVAAAHSAGNSIYFPAGDYLVTSFPTLNDYDTIHGDGSDKSTIIYSGSSTLITLTNKARVNFKNMGFFITGASGKGFQLSNCFSCSFESMVIRGNHTSVSYPTYLPSVGIRLDSNTGGTMIINCLIANFGTGLATYCIQNYVTNCKFTTNYTGVLGSGNDNNAGLSITNSEFVSDTDPDTTSRHLYIDGGKVIAEGTAKELKAKVGKDRLELTFGDATAYKKALGVIDGKGSEHNNDDFVITMTINDTNKDVAKVLNDLDKTKIKIESMAVHKPTLDDVFLSLTGKVKETEEEK